MSHHIEAGPDDIAERVLLPGDPLRAKWIAEGYLKDVKLYNKVRGMFGYTGYTTEGKRISVQGSGMGMPSLAVYLHELIKDYGVREIIRVGSCGALDEDIPLGQIILAQGACSDSAINRRRFRGLDFAPIASWKLLQAAYEASQKKRIPVKVGNIVANDLFYNDAEENQMWADAGCLAAEMETAELYTQAAIAGVDALTILTVTNNIMKTADDMLPDERETGLGTMIQLALAIAM